MAGIEKYFKKGPNGQCEFSRRGFLYITGAAAVLALPGCGGSASPSSGASPPPPPSTRLSEEQVYALSGRDRLIHEIDSLPKSPIQKLLAERIKPMFTLPPKRVERGELSYLVYESNVELIEHDEPYVMGRYSPRVSEKSDPPPFFVLQPIFVRIPLDVTLKKSEYAIFGSEARARDNTPLINFPLSPDEPLYTGIAAKIILDRPRREKDPEKRKIQERYERFFWIKEASSLLLNDLLMEHTYKGLRRNYLPTTIKVIDQYGNIGDIELITPVLLGYKDQRRMFALVDIGGYVLTYKALENDPDMPLKKFDADNPNYKLLREKYIKGTDLGKMPEEILRNTFQLILENPELQNFIHEGDMDQLPMNISTPSIQSAFSITPLPSLPIPLPFPGKSALTYLKIKV